eukprot:768444-Hanusia_phi.AAC.1
MLHSKLIDAVRDSKQENFEKANGLEGEGKVEDCIQACSFLKSRHDVLKSIGWDLVHVLIPFVVDESYAPASSYPCVDPSIQALFRGRKRDARDVRQQQMLLAMLAEVFPKLAKGKLHIFVKDLQAMLHRRFLGLAAGKDRFEDHEDGSPSSSAERMAPASPNQMRCDRNSALQDVSAPSDLLILNKGFFDAVIPACQTFLARLLDDMSVENCGMICELFKDLLKALHWTSAVVSTSCFDPSAEKNSSYVFDVEGLSRRVVEALDMIASLPNGILFILYPPSRPYWMIGEPCSMEQVGAELEDNEDLDDEIDLEIPELPALREYLLDGAGSLCFFMYLSSSSRLDDERDRSFFHPFRGVLILPGISELLSSQWSNHVRAGMMLLDYAIKGQQRLVVLLLTSCSQEFQEHGNHLSEKELEHGTAGLEGKPRQICMQIVQGLATAMTQLPEYAKLTAEGLQTTQIFDLRPGPRATSPPCLVCDRPLTVSTGFAVMKDLITRCPYPSVTAVALTIVKDEILHSWPTSQDDIDVRLSGPTLWITSWLQRYQHDTQKAPFIALSVSLLFEILASSQKALLLHRSRLSSLFLSLVSPLLPPLVSCLA